MGWRALAGVAMVAGALVPSVTWGANGPSVERILAGAAEKIGLSGRKGPSLFRPGYAVGEYTGSFKAMKRQSNVFGVATSDKAKTSFDVGRPGMAPVTAECAGGQGRIGLGWITFKRSDLSYVCIYGGSAPPGAELDLAESKGGGFGALIQAQRTAEMSLGRISLRAETRYVSGVPLGGGKAFSYVISRSDGAPVGGLVTNGLRPTFYLPRQPGPERDAVAVMAITLFAFQDPGPNG